MYVIGLDIGTTTICASVIDGETGCVRESSTVDSDSFYSSNTSWEKLQNPRIILEKAMNVLKHLTETYAPIEAIGITGQMHGMVYIDDAGLAVSPLYIWQDGRGNLLCKNEKTYAETLSDVTGYCLATGFGAVTHFYNRRNHLVPDTARHFCTIHDYIGMQLTGRKNPLVHISDAASFGVYDSVRHTFDKQALEEAGMDISIFPDVTDKAQLLGNTVGGIIPAGIPVAVAIGDNQASFIGSVQDIKKSILVNMGTGSQVSVMSPRYAAFPSGETRPLMEDNYLLVGSALCGGRAYATLEKFFRRMAVLMGAPDQSQYAIMDKLSEQAFSLEDKWMVSTAFSGTRRNPNSRGSIQGLGVNNFTPEHLVTGVLEGTVDELYQLYREMEPLLAEKPAVLVGSGNGIRKSVVWQRLFSEAFGMKVRIPVHKEEAAYGAALFALVAVGVYPSLEAAQQIIHYQPAEDNTGLPLKC